MQNDYSVGKKVYSGGLPNAQSGTRNPSGYIDREQKRSGLAAAAMRIMEQRQNGGQKPQEPQPTQLPHLTVDLYRQFGLDVTPDGKITSKGSVL